MFIFVLCLSSGGALARRGGGGGNAILVADNWLFPFRSFKFLFLPVDRNLLGTLMRTNNTTLCMFHNVHSLKTSRNGHALSNFVLTNACCKILSA
jgi:hypothetical protein